MDLLGALDVGHRAVDRGAVDWRVMPDDDRVVTLKRLERLENDHPVNEHVFTGANHFDHWMIVLESLKALQGYDTIIIGHDTPVDRSAIDSTMTYVKRANEIHAASPDAKSYGEKLKAAFPDLQQAGFVDLSASYLYAAPH